MGVPIGTCIARTFCGGFPAEIEFPTAGEPGDDGEPLGPAGPPPKLGIPKGIVTLVPPREPLSASGDTLFPAEAGGGEATEGCSSGCFCFDLDLSC